MLNEVRGASNRFRFYPVDARCTMSVDRAIIDGEAQVSVGYLPADELCVLIRTVLFMARDDGRRISTSALEEEWMARNVSVVCPLPHEKLFQRFSIRALADSEVQLHFVSNQQ